jgi:hypothetical protein
VHTRAFAVILTVLTATITTAQQTPPASESTALTIYNDNFAVARTTVELNLQPGLNDVTTTQVTTQLEPDSVVLRNPSSQATSGHNSSFRILEQNYDAGVVTQEWLLQKFEGKTIDFQLPPIETAIRSAGTPQFVPAQTVKGKILRAGGPEGHPLIEVNGQLQFQFPGLPLFPAATDGLLLKPTLRWQIESDKAQKLDAELAYITGGLSWQATYNVIAPETANVTGEQQADVLGWVTINNNSGSEFPAARIKLMAGDVAKIQPEAGRFARNRNFASLAALSVQADSNEVTQKAFDDFHLYDLHRTVQLRDGETKQVQFLDASGVALTRAYLYDGAASNLQPVRSGRANEEEGYGLDPSNTKVKIVQEFKNTLSLHLGIPLPSGRLRLYRRDSDGQIEFIGESLIPHTPTEDTVKIATGNAFDVKGARTQTDFHVNNSGHTLDESFQITLTNQKPQPVTVTVVERLYRCANWDITDKSAEYTKTDSHTIQFPVQVPAKGESIMTYSVRYTW